MSPRECSADRQRAGAGVMTMPAASLANPADCTPTRSLSLFNDKHSNQQTKMVRVPVWSCAASLTRVADLPHLAQSAPATTHSVTVSGLSTATTKTHLEHFFS